MEIGPWPNVVDLETTGRYLAFSISAFYAARSLGFIRARMDESVYEGDAKGRRGGSSGGKRRVDGAISIVSSTGR